MKLLVFVGMGIAGLASLVAFDPISMLTLRIGSLLVGSTVIYLRILTVDTIRSWLRQSRPLYKEALAFAVKQELTNGHIRILTGFFDMKEETIKNSQVYESERLDAELEGIFPKNEQIVIFT